MKKWFRHLSGRIHETRRNIMSNKPTTTEEGLQKAAKNPGQGGNKVAEFLKNWIFRNRFYILAFFIPVILTYIAYAIFGLTPFGKKSVLALDFNAQYVYYFEYLRDAFWGRADAMYSWSRNLSGGFMGVIGYYLASPFTLIVMILPRSMILESLLIMILCKIGSASVTFNLYLQKSKKLAPMQATLFSILFSMSAYMVIQTVDPMWLDGLVLLPLIVLGIEYLVDDGRKLYFIIPIALMFIANFYIGFMIGIFSAIYFVYYLFFGTESRIRKAAEYGNIILNFAVSTMVALMCSAWMILPVYHSLQLGKFDFTKPDYSFTTQFNPINILAQLMVCQYDSVNVQGSPEIYCGILTVCLLPLFFLNSRISMKKKMGAGFLLAAMFFSMYIKPVDMMWHGGQVPNWLPFRYSFIISFILLSLAASAFKELEGVKLSSFGCVFFAILGISLYINDKGYEHLDIMRSIWMSIGLAGVYLIMLYLFHSAKCRKLITGLTLLVISGEMIFNAVFTMKSLDKEVVYSTKASYESFVEGGRDAVKLMNKLDNGLYRSEKTYTRCINDNAAFGLKGLTHSSSVMNAKVLTFIETLGYSSRSYYSRYDGTTELADSLLGIKYVLDKGDKPERSMLHPSYKRIADYSYADKDDLDADKNPRQKTIGIYQNPNALSIGYMVDSSLMKLDHLGNDNPFNSQNIFFSTMVGNTVFDEAGQIAGFEEYYTRIPTGEPELGDVTISDYNGQNCYTKGGTGDPTVTYTFTVESDKRIYAFLKTENEMPVNLWLGIWDEELQNYEFKGFGTYFETRNYCIMDMGVYEPGTKIALRATVREDATIIKDAFFYYFNEELYQRDIDILKQNQLNVKKYSDTYIKGTVTAGQNQILFTSIPSEPGWTVTIDGKKTEPLECVKAMLAVQLEPGEHTVTFRYIAPGLLPGLFLLVLGIGMVVMFYKYDKKNHKASTV